MAAIVYVLHVYAAPSTIPHLYVPKTRIKQNKKTTHKMGITYEGIKRKSTMEEKKRT
jgi:hypothetical protein